MITKEKKVYLTEREIDILYQLVNRLQVESLRNTRLDVIDQTMSKIAQQQWFKESVEEHDFLMNLKAKLKSE